MKSATIDPARTLARLSFWVPAGRMAEFEAEYEIKLVPLLKKHGLVEPAQRGRKTVAGVFSRLFEMETPAAVVAKGKALEEDLAWEEMLRELGRIFGAEERAMRYSRAWPGRQCGGFHAARPGRESVVRGRTDG